MNKIYIMGAITGREEMASILFETAEEELRALGYEPINPMKLNHDHDKKWASYMKVCIPELLKCDKVAVIVNQELLNSKGAVIEAFLAKQVLGIEEPIELQEKDLFRKYIAKTKTQL
jgi:hypothetical protein